MSVDATTLPGGVVATPTNMGGGDTYIASVKDGDVRMSLDFGYKGGNPASIGDTVWIDTNGNGVTDAGEPGLSGIGLNLYTTGVDGIGGNADDQFVAFNITDANGQYTFSVLLPGEYYVKLRPLNIPAGLVATGIRARRVPARMRTMAIRAKSRWPQGRSTDRRLRLPAGLRHCGDRRPPLERRGRRRRAGCGRGRDRRGDGTVEARRERRCNHGHCDRRQLPVHQCDGTEHL